MRRTCCHVSSRRLGLEARLLCGRWALHRDKKALLKMAAVENGGAHGRALNDVLTNLPTTIFSVMTSLAAEHDSVNLGQGFPDAEGPALMKVP